MGICEEVHEKNEKQLSRYLCSVMVIEGKVMEIRVEVTF